MTARHFPVSAPESDAPFVVPGIAIGRTLRTTAL